jgi:hypothetical protein
MTTLNWADLQAAAGEAGFDPVPAGLYDVVVDTAESKTASTGKQMIACRFKITSGPYEGKSVFNNFVISSDNPNALAFFFRHMTALGLGEAYFASSPPLERVAADLAGRRCRIQVSIRNQQDQPARNQVDTVLPPAGGPATVSVPAVTSPAAPVAGMPPVPAAAVPGVPTVTSSTPATPPPPPAAPHIGTDDLPF